MKIPPCLLDSTGRASVIGHDFTQVVVGNGDAMASRRRGIRICTRCGVLEVRWFDIETPVGNAVDGSVYFLPYKSEGT